MSEACDRRKESGKVVLEAAPEAARTGSESAHTRNDCLASVSRGAASMRFAHACAHPVSSAAMAVASEREFGLYINGEATEPSGGEVADLAEPATGEPLAKVALAGEGDVDRAVEAARAALEGPWGKTPPNERSRLLHA